MTKPNIIFFLTDQQRFDTTGVHHNPLGLTPNFDRMAATGTHLYQAFTPQPVCGPARSVLQTGLYATQTTCWRNGIALPHSQKTLAHYFNEAGYQTGYIGKWHLADFSVTGPVKEEDRGGYQYWLASNVLEFTSDAFRVSMYDNNNQEVRLPGYRVDAVTDAAIRYIDQHQENPFFLFLSYIEPHFQNTRDDYPAPDGYAEQYTGRWIPPDLAALGGTTHQHIGGYYGMVKRLDEALGRLTDALKSLDLLEDTIIVFTSDHGNHFKTRNSEYKRSCHESSIRVPMAISGPGFNSGGRIDKLVSLIDLPPTLLDAASIPVPQEMQGHSLLPLVQRQTSKWPEEVFVQISESQVGRAIRTDRWKYSIIAPNLNGNQASCSEVYAEDCLYDLLADPYELRNLVENEAVEEIKRDLRERLVRCMVEAGESAPSIEESAVTEKRGQRAFEPLTFTRNRE
jgi:arylsulfatase A-like enzyme